MLVKVVKVVFADLCNDAVIAFPALEPADLKRRDTLTRPAIVPNELALVFDPENRVIAGVNEFFPVAHFEVDSNLATLLG